MFTSYEFEKINSEYNRQIKEKQTKALKIWAPIFLISVIVIVIIISSTDWIKSEPGSILVPVYGGIAVIGSLVAILVSKFGISQKPAFNYLYKEIYDKINADSGNKIKYYPFEKTDNDFIEKGGLFSGYARVKTNRHVIGNFEGTEYHILDCMLITGSGKNQTVHLNGIYYYFKEKSNTLLQVRSNGRPHYKGHKFEKVDSSDIFKVFVEEGKTIQGNDRQYIHNLSETKNRLNAKKIYFSKTIDEMHFAYVPVKQIRKQNNLTLQRLNELYSFFEDEVIVVKELMTVSGDYNF